MTIKIQTTTEQEVDIKTPSFYKSDSIFFSKITGLAIITVYDGCIISTSFTSMFFESEVSKIVDGSIEISEQEFNERYFYTLEKINGLSGISKQIDELNK